MEKFLHTTLFRAITMLCGTDGIMDSLSIIIDLHNFGHVVQSLANTCLFGVSS